MNELQRMETGLSIELLELIEKGKSYIEQAKAKSTAKAYRSDWQQFLSWCVERSLTAMPAAPDTLVVYLSALADGHKASTIQRKISAISQAHQSAGAENPVKHPTVKAAWAGIRHVLGTRQHGKDAVMTDDLRRMLATLDDSLIGKRDRALLLIGFGGAFRRSEIVSLDMSDVEFRKDGLVVTLRRSKTDQEGAGRVIGIPYGTHLDTCPVRSLQTWLEASGISEGPLFRSVNRHGQLQPGRLGDKAVALVVKRSAEASGLDPAKYSGHSLRAGHATSAAAEGAPERVIAQQTGHRSLEMVRRYIRDARMFRENSAHYLGL